MTARDDAEVVEAVAAVLHGASWPDGDTSGFPTFVVCRMLAAALLPFIREREAAAWERALREAADAARGMHDPVAPDCAEWADWLDVRAAANPYAGSEGGDE